ncbi:MAG: hypothetical protein ACI8W7_001435 [Gammaproteobacteria bacterium]|jgi:hypothetical protein
MNPEFQRYMWLELTPHRLLAAPLLLSAFFSVVYMINSNDASWSLAIAGYWITIGLGVLWGARNASEAVIGEVREGTWDQQRLSCLGPWAMTWGKLFGAPVFIWYSCLPALALILLGATLRWGLSDAVGHLLLLIAVLVFAHAMGLLLSLQRVEQSTMTAGRSMVGVHLLGLVAGALLVGPAYSAFVEGWGEPVRWFAIPISQQWFTYLSTASLVVWTVIGCYRLMRTELQMRNAPWVWITFVMYCMTYAAGLVWTNKAVAVQIGLGAQITPVASAALAAYFVAMALAAMMLFIEPKDPVEFRRLFGSFQQRRWQVVMQSIPRWLCVLPIAIVMIWVVLSLDPVHGIFCASIMAFFARDAGIVVLLNMSANRRRADGAAMLYLLVLYGLLPTIIYSASGVSVDAWLFPAVNKSVLVAVAPAVLQAVLVWALVTKRWHALGRTVLGPLGSGAPPAPC